MVKLFALGVVLLALRLAQLAFKAGWGIKRSVLMALGISLVLLALFAAGVVSFAVPLLLFGLLGAFLLPCLNQI